MAAAARPHQACLPVCGRRGRRVLGPVIPSRLPGGGQARSSPAQR